MQTLVPYSRSRAEQASEIVKLLPQRYGTYFEPFLWDGAVLYSLRPSKGVCSDSSEARIRFWEAVQRMPERLGAYYADCFDEVWKYGPSAYREILRRFNIGQTPADYLFLANTRKIGTQRRNSYKGSMNQSLLLPEITPDRMYSLLKDWSSKIQGVKFRLRKQQPLPKQGDVILFDPRLERDPEVYDTFIQYLESLTAKQIRWFLLLDQIYGDEAGLASRLSDIVQVRHIRTLEAKGDSPLVQNTHVYTNNF